MDWWWSCRSHYVCTGASVFRLHSTLHGPRFKPALPSRCGRSGSRHTNCWWLSSYFYNFRAGTCCHNHVSHLTNENSRSRKVNGFPPPVHSAPPNPFSSPHRPPLKCHHGKHQTFRPSQRTPCISRSKVRVIMENMLLVWRWSFLGHRDESHLTGCTCKNGTRWHTQVFPI